MHSSGENSRKQKDDSDKRGEYRKFDQISSQMRETLIRQCAEQVIANAEIRTSCAHGCKWQNS